MADCSTTYRSARCIAGAALLVTAVCAGVAARDRILRRTELATGEPRGRLRATGGVRADSAGRAGGSLQGPRFVVDMRRTPRVPAALLDRLAACLALVDVRVSELVDFCARPERPTKLPDFSWLANSETAPLVRYNMRLYYARWLAENGYDDEALSWTDGLSPTDVVAAGDAFVLPRGRQSSRGKRRSRGRHRGGVAPAVDELPIRYQKLAVLMQKDLAGLEDDSLDHMARRMADVRRGSIWAAPARRCKASKTAWSRRSIS